MHPVAWKIKRNIHWKIHISRDCLIWHPLEIRHLKTQRLEYGPLSVTFIVENETIWEKCFMGRPVFLSSMSQISNNTGGKESKLQFYFASILNPSLGSRDSTSFLFTHVSRKWILKLNSGTHVQRPVLTDQSAGQTAGGAHWMPLQTNQKSGFGLSESISRVQACLCTVKARHAD